MEEIKTQLEALLSQTAVQTGEFGETGTYLPEEEEKSVAPNSVTSKYEGLLNKGAPAPRPILPPQRRGQNNPNV